MQDLPRRKICYHTASVNRQIARGSAAPRCSACCSYQRSLAKSTNLSLWLRFGIFRSSCEHCRRYCKAEYFGCGQVDDEINPSRLLYREFPRPRPPQNLVYIVSGAPNDACRTGVIILGPPIPWACKPASNSPRISASMNSRTRSRTPISIVKPVVEKVGGGVACRLEGIRLRGEFCHGVVSVPALQRRMIRGSTRRLRQPNSHHFRYGTGPASAGLSLCLARGIATQMVGPLRVIRAALIHLIARARGHRSRGCCLRTWISRPIPTRRCHSRSLPESSLGAKGKAAMERYSGLHFRTRTHLTPAYVATRSLPTC